MLKHGLLLLALMVPCAGAGAGSLRDGSQVDIAPAIEGGPGSSGFQVLIVPKAIPVPPVGSADLAEAPDARTPGTNPLRPERGLGLAFGLEEDGLPELLSPGSDFAGMIQFRKPLP